MMNSELTTFDVISTSSLKVGDLIYWDKPSHSNTRSITPSRLGTPYLVIENKFVVGEPVTTFINVANNEIYTHYSFQFAFIEKCKRI